MKKVLLLSFSISLAVFFSCKHVQHAEITAPSNDTSFQMVYMSDIHLQPEQNAVTGFRKALDTINKLSPELVLTGGDLIMDALNQPRSRVDSLYFLYKAEIKRLTMPVYNTIGNHELYAVFRKDVDTTDSLYGLNMFKKYLGNPYYAFAHKNWKFFVLDGIYATKERKYTGYVDSAQISWLKKELSRTDTKTPLAISIHIPLLTSLSQFENGALAANTEGLVVSNSKEVLDLFKGYNLKLVLQGHLHILEDNYIHNIHFITDGAVCGAWWKGPNKGTQEGFLLLNFKGGNVSWKYVDYGWSPEI